VLPFHSLVCPGLLRGIVDDAESLSDGTDSARNE
jgi:hypothetical protein